MAKHGIDASASATAVSEPSTSTHLQQVPAGVAASLRDHANFRPPDVDTLLAAVAPAPCVWCGDADCDRRFDHARDYAGAESTWRELAEGGAR